MRGKFIVFEGLDRCGKTTQVAKLVERLENARLQKFPGKMIDAYLQSKADMDDRAIHLLFSANRWECSNGVTVIADRYAFSGIAFSAAKGLPLPDLVINLSLSPEEAAKRGQYGEERYESLDMQQRTRAQFKLVAEAMEKRHPGRWVEVDAAGSVEEVADRIWEVVQGTGAEGDLGKLWI